MKARGPVIVILLAAWLAGWIVLSWGAVQDDALIHLRYADYLHRLHFITFDGITHSYGASSLFYVGLLSVVRGFTLSPFASRAVSTTFHLLLFAGVAYAYLRSLNRRSSLQWSTLCLLILLVSPSAIRWLEDGMETSLVLCAAGGVAWWTYRMSHQSKAKSFDQVIAVIAGCLLIFLRPELGMLALFASAIVWLAQLDSKPSNLSSARLRALVLSSHFVVGSILGALAIRVLMQHFLPDTALAKSHGIAAFGSSLRAAGTVITGALLFGLGLAGLWIVSAALVLSDKQARFLPTLLANSLFPVVLLASALRGQEIQGVRYLAWCFFFSICWNLLELADLPPSTLPGYAQAMPLALIILCLMVLPFESHLMYRVLRTRVRTMTALTHEDLASALHHKVGVAGDVGYISYFADDAVCDLAGLVNGRAAAAMSSQQRLARCASLHPEFAFLNAGQAGAFSEYMDLSQWKVCGEYDFGNLRSPDRHYLLVSPGSAAPVCKATGETAAPAVEALSDSTY